MIKGIRGADANDGIEDCRESITLAADAAGGGDGV
jgi:hypothetical protein